MQTFLPYKSFGESAKCLDYRRLGKQRVETKQLLLGQFKNHPAAKMWKGYETALALYGTIICSEWLARGYKDKQLMFFVDHLRHLSSTDKIPMPYWLGDERFHSAHRANLLRKDPEFYGQYGWTEKPQEGYWWPV